MDNSNDTFGDSSSIMDGQQDWIPKIGMEFDTLDSAFEFWKAYSKKIGFGVRKDYNNKNRKTGVITSQLFVCCKEGRKREKKDDTDTIRQRSILRTNCEVRLKVFLDKQSGKYVVKEFVEEHNHELQPLATSHMLRSHRELTTTHALAIELASDSGLAPKATQELMSREAGGRDKLGFVIEDQKSYLRSRRKRNMAYGELGSIFTYFEKQNMIDPRFYYALQLDNADQVTNIFWANAKMVADYVTFGDVVTFDTTFSTNEGMRPLGVFTGYNHHRQIVIFGAALLYDETAESFMWLFNTFVSAHGGKEPRTIFTDQDAAMANALAAVWPKVSHGLCTWHIRQNALKHLGCYMRNKSPFMKEFNRCIYEYDEEKEFEIKWQKMLEDYNLTENSWLTRIYGKKEKWAKAYMKNSFTLGIRSTQMCESVNSDLKDHLKSTLSVGDFFKHFDRILDQKQYNELEAEYKMRENVPSLGFSKSPILKQVSQRYTPKIFNLFKEEYGCVDSFIIKDEIRDTCVYVVTPHDLKEKEYKVVCDISNDMVTCSCMKFESEGMLCCHILRVFSRLNVTNIPEKYILARLTRTIKSQLVLDEGKSKKEEDAKDWIRRVQSQLLRLTYQASMNKDTRVCMEIMISECSKKLEDFTMGNEVDTNKLLERRVNSQMQNINGLKKKEGQKGKRRVRPPYEIRRKKVKKTSNMEPTLDLNLKSSQDFVALSLSDIPSPLIEVSKLASCQTSATSLINSSQPVQSILSKEMDVSMKKNVVLNEAFEPYLHMGGRESIGDATSFESYLQLISNMELEVGEGDPTELDVIGHRGQTRNFDSRKS